MEAVLINSAPARGVATMLMRKCGEKAGRCESNKKNWEPPKDKIYIITCSRMLLLSIYTIE